MSCRSSDTLQVFGFAPRPAYVPSSPSISSIIHGTKNQLVSSMHRKAVAPYRAHTCEVTYTSAPQTTIKWCTTIGSAITSRCRSQK